MSDRDELIAKARELSAAASPGPWGIAGGYIKGADTYPVCEPWPPIDRNGRFIAESRTLLPALADLAESEGRRADEAERELRSIKSEHAHCDQVLRQRDRWEDQVGDMAAQAGCDNEFTSDHDHSHCVTEAVSLLRSQCDAALAELAKLKGQQP
jgi:hypothetical protein